MPQTVSELVAGPSPVRVLPLSESVSSWAWRQATRRNLDQPVKLTLLAIGRALDEAAAGDGAVLTDRALAEVGGTVDPRDLLPYLQVTIGTVRQYCRYLVAIGLLTERTPNLFILTGDAYTR